MSYYKKNREALLKKAYNKCHNGGGKEKAAKYYQENKEEIKKKERNKYKNMSEDEKNVIRERSKNRYHKNKQKLKEIMQKIHKKKTEVTKKEFYESKEGIKLKDVIVDNIVVNGKVKGNNEIVKYYTGYIVDENVVPLALLLPVMSGWIKYFEIGGKNMSFKIEDDEVYLKYNEIWKKIKDMLSGVRLSSDVIYNDQYIKTKVKTFKMIKICLIMIKYLKKN